LSFALALCGCAPKPTAPAVTPPVQRLPYSSDYPFAWAPDGRTIAFRRIIRSSAGPPGIYVVQLGDHHPRYLFPANLLWPMNGSFSSDGRRLLLSYALRIYIIDVASGKWIAPFYTPSGEDFPVWTNGDNSIMYIRVYGDVSLPPDSFGVHAYSLLDHVDRAVSSAGEVLRASDICSLPIDGRVALENFGPQGHRILLARPDGSDLATLFQADPGRLISDLQPFLDPVRGRRGVVFGYGPYPAVFKSYFADVSGSPADSLPNVSSHFDRISPDGTRVLTAGLAPGDSVISLFIRPLLDRLSRPPVQVTWWSPPQP